MVVFMTVAERIAHINEARATYRVATKAAHEAFVRTLDWDARSKALDVAISAFGDAFHKIERSIAA